MVEEERKRLRALGLRVRQLRAEAGMTGAELASRASVGQPAVSKIETGRMLASVEVLGRIADALAVGDVVRAELLDELALAQQELSLRRRQSARWFLGDDDPLLGARIVRSFQCSMMPPLVQTAEYARRVMATAWDVSAEDAARVVAGRVERQSTLYDAGRTFTFVVTEGALRTWTGSTELIRAQLDRVSMVAMLDAVRVGVIPWTAPVPELPRHGFTLYDDTEAVVETFSEEVRVSESAAVRAYGHSFDRYEESALFGAEAAMLLAEIARSFEAHSSE